MNLLKKLKSIAALMLAFGFLTATTLTSCGNKKQDEDTTEHMDEHSGDSAEHPSDDESEHPE
ncbi:MAG: hypothetical protein WD398_07860 [Cyclobacteriaceae bacterium]